MNWTRLAAVVIGAGVASSLTDWFFAGDWLHLRRTYPEIWRAGEGRAIALSAPLPFLTCADFAYLAVRLGQRKANPGDAEGLQEICIDGRLGLRGMGEHTKKPLVTEFSTYLH